MNLTRYMQDRLDEYERLIYKLVSKYDTSMGEWGRLAPLRSMEQVRHVFICRTRGCFHGLRRGLNIEQAYKELRTLLKHPTAREIELMSESVKQY